MHCFRGIDVQSLLSVCLGYDTSGYFRVKAGQGLDVYLVAHVSVVCIDRLVS